MQYKDVTREWREKQLKKQNGKCLICKKELSLKGARSGRAVIDHCHLTGKSRHLLCMTCNMGLGMFHDDPELLVSAVVYLKLHCTRSEQRVKEFWGKKEEKRFENVASRLGTSWDKLEQALSQVT